MAVTGWVDRMVMGITTVVDLRPSRPQNDEAELAGVRGTPRDRSARPGAAVGLEDSLGAQASGRALVVVAPAPFLGKIPIVDLLENDPDPINHDRADYRNANEVKLALGRGIVARYLEQAQCKPDGGAKRGGLDNNSRRQLDFHRSHPTARALSPALPRLAQTYIRNPIRKRSRSILRGRLVAFEQGTHRDQFVLAGIADLHDADVWYLVGGTDLHNLPYSAVALKALPRLNIESPTSCHA